MYPGVTSFPGATAFPGVGDPSLLLEELYDAPCPRVGVTVVNLDSTAASRITVWRSVEGMRRRAVRGARSTTVLGSAYFMDFEAPLGVPVTYILEVHSGAVVPEWNTATVTLESATGWLQDPLNPATAVPVAIRGDGTKTVVLETKAFRDFARQLPGEMVTPMGAELPVFLGGARMAAMGIPFHLFTAAAEQNTALRNLLMSAGVVLLRGSPQWQPFPSAGYMAVQGSEQPVNTHSGGSLTRWSLSGDLVAPPAVNVVVPTWSYDDVAALWADYAQAQDAADLAGLGYTGVQADPTMGVGQMVALSAGVSDA